VAASETGAFEQYRRRIPSRVLPGEVVTIDDKGIEERVDRRAEPVRPAHCIFERSTFADPASDVFGENVH